MTYNGQMYIRKKEWYVFKEITVKNVFKKFKARKGVFKICLKLTTTKKDTQTAAMILAKVFNKFSFVVPQAVPIRVL